MSTATKRRARHAIRYLWAADSYAKRHKVDGLLALAITTREMREALRAVDLATHALERSNGSIHKAIEYLETKA